MDTGSGATWDDWATAFGTAQRMLPDAADVACPRCASRTLRIAFMAWPDQHQGVGFFWCDTCLFGIGLSRATIPPGTRALPFGLAEDELRPYIPNYTLVPRLLSDQFAE
jgi:hypothetical protein